LGSRRPAKSSGDDFLSRVLLGIVAYAGKQLQAFAATFSQPAWPARLFILIAFPITLLMAQITPIGLAPDETAHVVRADSVTHLQLIGHRHALDNGIIGAFVVSDPAFVSVGEPPPKPLHQFSADIVERQRNTPRQGRHDVYVPNTASYSPVMYVPAALGIQLGRILGFGPYDCWLLARFFSAAAFVACGVLALRIAPGWWVFAVLSLPMTLLLASAVHPDGLNIAVLAVSLALLVRDRQLWLRS
jgi:uncharacterized membrane protein